MGDRIITLTTDFGSGSPYVAEMKGAILSVDPDATIIDLTHDIAAQDIRQGALALVQGSIAFPEKSIHVAVVDPGVGTDRCLIYAAIGGRHYIAPDNGLLHGLARHATPDRIVALTNQQFWRSEVSATFHGRDILAPVAAHLSLGVDPQQLGDELLELVRLDWPEVRILPGKIEGTIQ